MAFEKCGVCGQWDVGPHRCKPKFEVWCEEAGQPEEDAGVFYASDAEEAAERWAEDDDISSADYSIVSQRSEPVVSVRDCRDGEVKLFRVTGEAVPSYSASEISA